MAYIYWPFLITVAVISLFGQSCEWPSRLNYEIDRTSPNGVYQVKIKSRAGQAKGTSKYTEHVEILFLKGQEVIRDYIWENTDQYELSFRDVAPIVEWVDNNVLRMGQDRSDQPFFDELIISNNTDEYLREVGVSYGRKESFNVFDLAPRSEITLRASPGFKPDGTSNSYLGYSGTAQSGKKFVGTMEGKKRTSSADGPLKFSIMINSTDLK
jgi:hypothetical protein